MPRKPGKPEEPVIEPMAGRKAPQRVSKTEAGQAVLVQAGLGRLIGKEPEAKPVLPTRPGHITRAITINGETKAMLVQSKLPWRR